MKRHPSPLYILSHKAYATVSHQNPVVLSLGANWRTCNHLGFRVEQLYGSREILSIMKENQDEVIVFAEILADRAEITMDQLKRLGVVVNNQAYNIFLFILEMGPAHLKQVKKVFPHSTVDRVLPKLEAVEVVEHRNYVYRVKRKTGDEGLWYPW